MEHSTATSFLHLAFLSKLCTSYMINEIKLFGSLILLILLPPLVFIFGSYKPLCTSFATALVKILPTGVSLSFLVYTFFVVFYVDSGVVTFGTYCRRFCAQVINGAIGHHHLSAWFRQRVFRLTKSQA